MTVELRLGYEKAGDGVMMLLLWFLASGSSVRSTRACKDGVFFPSVILLDICSHAVFLQCRNHPFNALSQLPNHLQLLATLLNSVSALLTAPPFPSGSFLPMSSTKKI